MWLQFNADVQIFTDEVQSKQEDHDIFLVHTPISALHSFDSSLTRVTCYCLHILHDRDPHYILDNDINKFFAC